MTNHTTLKNHSKQRLTQRRDGDRRGRCPSTLERLAIGLALVSIALSGLVSCSRAKPVQTTEVTVNASSFDPPYIEAKRGETVWWTNTSDQDHVISFRGFDSVEIFLYKGTKRGFAFTEAREYTVYCKIHNFEGRALIVEPEP